MIQQQDSSLRDSAGETGRTREREGEAGGPIGDFELIEPLGQGGMGVVWRARHRVTGELVALKRVAAPVEGAIDGLRREIRALAMIDHPGVVRLIAEGAIDGQPWLAMELLDGTSLRKRLAHAWGAWFDTGPTVAVGEGGPLLPRALPAAAPGARDHVDALLAPMIALCDALAHVHAAGLVHRDLTPDNVLLRSDGRPVLVDFGLVARVSRGAGRDAVAVFDCAVGTAPYMAPEQIRGEIVDARADLYALGCILHEIACGAPPFVAPHTSGVLSAHLFDEPVPPSRCNPEAPAWLDAIVRGLLAKDPHDRTASASDVAAALARGLGRPRIARGTAPVRVFRPRLAGRDQVLAALAPALRRVIAGDGGWIAIAGPGGVGKTRLVVELAQSAASAGVRVIAGECAPPPARADRAGTPAGPLHPLRPLLQMIADRCRERGPEETARLLGRGGAALVPFEPALAQLCETAAAPAPAEPAAAPAPELVLAALHHAVAALAASRPLLLVLDDLQWADPLTLRFLASLRTAPLGPHNLAVIATYRDDEPAAAVPAELATATGGWTRVALAGLAPDAVRALADELLGAGAHAAPPALVDAVVARSAGVPLYVTAYLRHAIAGGMLARPAGGAWRLARPVADLPRSPAELMRSPSSDCSAPEGVRIQGEAPQPAVDLHPRLAQVAGHVADVAPVLLEERDEDLAEYLRVIEIQLDHRGPRGRSGRDGQVLRLDHAAWRERRRHREALLELADVERPVVREQPAARGGAEAELGRAGELLAPQQVADDEPEVLAPRAQRREQVAITGEACQQIRAIRALGSHPVERPVRGRDDPQIDLDRARAADGHDLALLQHAQERRLRRER